MTNQKTKVQTNKEKYIQVQIDYCTEIIKDLKKGDRSLWDNLATDVFTIYGFNKKAFPKFIMKQIDNKPDYFQRERGKQIQAEESMVLLEWNKEFIENQRRILLKNIEA